jgi:hypothetical protein
MKKSIIFACIATLIVGCSPKLEIPPGAVVRYENASQSKTVVVPHPLSDAITKRLSERPDHADRRTSLAAYNKNDQYLHIGSNTFHVLKNTLVLECSWGLRDWEIVHIGNDLEALIDKNPNRKSGSDQK